MVHSRLLREEGSSFSSALDVGLRSCPLFCRSGWRVYGVFGVLSTSTGGLFVLCWDFV